MEPLDHRGFLVTQEDQERLEKKVLLVLQDPKEKQEYLEPQAFRDFLENEVFLAYPACLA